MMILNNLKLKLIKQRLFSIGIMDEDKEVQQCTNCHKNFPTDKIDLHEAYCCRNIRKCGDCGEMVDNQDMEEHHKQKHSKKSCVHCQAQFMPSDLSSHENKCHMKPIVCQYCQNNYPFGQIPRHQQMCGARTKPCPICQKLIMLKDFGSHQAKCVKKKQEKREERAQVSQDNYVNRRQQNLQRGDRPRQNSINNYKQSGNRSNSGHHQKLVKPGKVKAANMIGPQLIKPSLDPVPISIRMAMRNRDFRVPLKSKN